MQSFLPKAISRCLVVRLSAWFQIVLNRIHHCTFVQRYEYRSQLIVTGGDERGTFDKLQRTPQHTLADDLFVGSYRLNTRRPIIARAASAS